MLNKTAKTAHHGFTQGNHVLTKTWRKIRLDMRQAEKKPMPSFVVTYKSVTEGAQGGG